VSLVLDPRMKYDYFERNWPHEWMEGVKDKMVRCWKANRGDMEESIVSTQDSTTKNHFDINILRFGAVRKREDELTRYLKAPLLGLEGKEANDRFDPLEWWKGNSKEYPTLYRIACNIYSIPAMSVEPERVFSGYRPVCCTK
jgi:hAT family protein